jgi:uncharacterized protein
MDLSVHDNRERSRYEIVGDGRLIGFADYRVVGDAVEFPHTEIIPSRRGQGYGARLVGGALDAVRTSGRRVVPLCSFVVEYIRDHPEAVGPDRCRQPSVADQFQVRITGVSRS